jgi:hypothetical protein
LSLDILAPGEIEVLNVWWGGRIVGRLTQDKHGGIGFAYEPDCAMAEHGRGVIDAITVAARLAAIERALSETLEQFTAKDGAPC